GCRTVLRRIPADGRLDSTGRSGRRGVLIVVPDGGRGKRLFAARSPPDSHGGAPLRLGDGGLFRFVPGLGRRREGAPPRDVEPDDRLQTPASRRAGRAIRFSHGNSLFDVDQRVAAAETVGDRVRVARI